MTTKNRAKVDSPVTIFGTKGVPFNRPFSALFCYTDGSICWPVTDFFADLQRGQNKDSTIGSYIRPLQDIVDFMSSLEVNDKPFQFTNASNQTLVGFRKWLKKTTTLSNRLINKRIRHFIDLLFYIQEEYEIDKHLIAKYGSAIRDASIYVNVKVSSDGNEYYEHKLSRLPQKKYTPRSPITTEAIKEVHSIINEHSKIKSKQAKYNSEVLQLSTDIFEATGIRAGELVRMGMPTLELLEQQLDEDDKTLEDIINSPNTVLTDYFDLDEIKELLDVISRIMAKDSEIIWLLVITNKSKQNAGEPRLLPIGRPLAEDIVDFYEDYVIEMIDLDKDKRASHNRSNCGYIIPKFDGKPFFNVKNLDEFEDILEEYEEVIDEFEGVIDEFEETLDDNGDGKLFSAFYSNKIGQVSEHKAHPHLFRHRFITNLVVKMLKETEHRDNKSLEVILHRVAKLSGHASIESLWHYIDSAKIILDNRALVTKRQKMSNFEAICKKHNLDLDSELAIEFKALLLL